MVITKTAVLDSNEQKVMNKALEIIDKISSESSRTMCDVFEYISDNASPNDYRWKINNVIYFDEI